MVSMGFLSSKISKWNGSSLNRNFFTQSVPGICIIANQKAIKLEFLIILLANMEVISVSLVRNVICFSLRVLFFIANSLELSSSLNEIIFSVL